MGGLTCALAFALQLVQRWAFRAKFSRCSVWINVGWWGEPIVVLVAFDFPVVVVKKHVVVSAEQYAVGQVSFAVVACPLVDVMGLGPAGRSVASSP